MTQISLSQAGAEALAWVAQGADKTEHGEVLIFDVSPVEVVISTNKSVDQRFMTVGVENADEGTYAIRAKAIAGIIRKMGEDDSLGILIEDNSFKIASGTTSISLNDLYESVIDIRGDFTDSLVTDTEGIVLPAISLSASSVSPDGIVHISGAEGEMTVDSQAGSIFTQDSFSASNIAGVGEFSFQVPCANVKAVKKMHDVTDPQEVQFHAGKGFIRIEVIDDEDSEIGSLSMMCPLSVTDIPEIDSPCNEDVLNTFSIAKKTLTGAISNISGVVGADAVVNLDSTQEGRVVFKVSDRDGSAKNVTMDARIDNGDNITVPVSSLNSAIKGISTKEIQFGTIDHGGRTWLAAMSVFDEDSEKESTDTIIAVATV